MAESEHIINATSGNFPSTVMNSDVPVLVDFWAPWYPPCRMLKPVVESLAEDLQGRVRVALVNVDENQDLAAKYGVRSIPFLMIVHQGKVVDSWMGYSPKSDLVTKLDAVLANG
jgi:thioredoxin 1